MNAVVLLFFFRKRPKKPVPRPKPYNRPLHNVNLHQQYPVFPNKLLDFGFDTIREGCSSYVDFDNYLSINGRRVVRHRGFLIGVKVEFPTVVSTNAPLHFGSYLLVDKDGEVVARATATAHVSLKCSIPKYCQYNPCSYPVVADMADLSMKPWLMTHHFALSHIPLAGKYQLVGLMDDGTMSNSEIWIENARCTTKYMKELEMERVDGYSHRREYYRGL